MSMSDWFGFNTTFVNQEMPEIYPVSIGEEQFVKDDVTIIFSKILTDVIDRTHGLSDDQLDTLWDNCIKSEASEGLITLLAKAMTDKKELFLVFEKALNVLRIATNDEQQKIKADYEKSGKSATGVYISFKSFNRADMIKFYSALEYSTVSALSKSMNLSKAVQIKMSSMRESTSLANSADLKTQGIIIANSLANGKDILIDAKDIVETTKPDLTAVQASITFLNQKRSFYLGLPESYINGEQTGGLGTTGENDTKAIERGLKNYYVAIIKPTLKALFEADTTYKSQDFRQITQALEAMKVFELTSEALLTEDNKKLIIENLLDIDPDDNIIEVNLDQVRSDQAAAEADAAKQNQTPFKKGSGNKTNSPSAP